MSHTILLENLVSDGFNSNTQFMLDTNAFKYRYEASSYRVVVTSGVLDELGRYPDVFPAESIRNIALLLDPKIIIPFVSKDDEYLITLATSKYPKKKRIISGIGWVDVEQIGYAMENAREGKKTVIVSNDGDIDGTVKALREMLPYMEENVVCASVLGYLLKKHKYNLRGIKKPFRWLLIREIESMYRVA